MLGALTPTAVTGTLLLANSLARNFRGLKPVSRCSPVVSP
jgi:hypothetical protein